MLPIIGLLRVFVVLSELLRSYLIFIFLSRYTDVVVRRRVSDLHAVLRKNNIYIYLNRLSARQLCDRINATKNVNSDTYELSRYTVRNTYTGFHVKISLKNIASEAATKFIVPISAYPPSSRKTRINRNPCTNRESVFRD